jgi:hypothetical protein
MPQDISSLDKPQLLKLCTVLLEMALKNEKGAIFGIFIEKVCDENLVSEPLSTFVTLFYAKFIDSPAPPPQTI